MFLLTGNEISETDIKKAINCTIATIKNNKILRNVFNQGGERSLHCGT